MKAPAFQYPGGKARLRSWLLPAIPRTGRLYLEPFAGRGNVFFAARAVKRFERWHLNDPNTAAFLRALREVDPEDLPETVDRAEYQRLKDSAESAVSRVVEPRVTFFGRGWPGGFKGANDMSKIVRGHAGPNVYSGVRYRQVVLAAAALLGDAEVTDLSWERLPWGDLGEDDFVYFDPPYLGTQHGKREFGQIDHGALLDVVAGARFRWLLSGNDSDLYRRRLGAPQGTFRRTAAMRVMGRRGEEGAHQVECLWTDE